MRQILLALILIAIPVAGFSAFQVYTRNTASAAGPAAGLGDLSPFQAIVGDVQVLVSKGDVAGARKRITDYESAWDSAETAIRPLNQDQWGNIDDASDAALKSVRASDPKPDEMSARLAALMHTLQDPTTSP